MNTSLQGPKCTCHLAPERLATQNLRATANRAPFTSVRHSDRSTRCGVQRSRCRVASTSEASTSVSTSSPTYSPKQKGLPQSRVWELDFCSRPLLDERGKKRWELLICSPDREFEYSAFFPNNKINSTQVLAENRPRLPIHGECKLRLPMLSFHSSRMRLWKYCSSQVLRNPDGVAFSEAKCKPS